MSFTQAELDYLASQRLGRLATVNPDGTPQNNPVGFRHNPELGTIDIGGHNLSGSRKFHNVRRHPLVSFVVDDLASVHPWRVRGVEIRGRAEALTGTDPLMPGMGGELIRIHPTRILSWGVDPDRTGMYARNAA